MPARTVAIGSSVGHHARPAQLFVTAVQESGLAVTIGRPGGAHMDARSILGVMALGAKHAEEVELSVEGDGADAVLADLVALLERDLDSE
ncbi:HPr family phosphocarrier protein [Demequina capsici]|uniref:HPr family phosphocarrier protein n=1 Tax=Demequina capsici TaxID=3075620 RepID=A0AA96JB24_9MICO|nr:HPr family phosphocarrier protein [Demequina sp. PMTSA13]WNM27960.1 HPr family phosphocarrier protein [Demequina sp. PMTSA13]